MHASRCKLVGGCRRLNQRTYRGLRSPGTLRFLRSPDGYRTIQPITKKLYLTPASNASSVTVEEKDTPASTAEKAHEEQTAQFDWSKQWYPIAVVDQLDPKRPTAFTLLGKDVVIWQDGAKAWHVFEDRCPHRLAPLSEGRIEPSNGSLMCSYHGWTFDGQGKCLNIPQIGDEKAAAVATTSSRACAAKHPTQVVQGLLWVWADSSVSAAIDCTMKQPEIIPELDQPGWSMLTGSWFWRDLPYSYDTLLENLFDPSHIPFAHHKVMGVADRSKATPLSIRTVQHASLAGFELARDKAPFKTRVPMDVQNYFRPPSSNKSVQTTGKRTIVLQFYAVPTRPGQSRAITAFVANFQVPFPGPQLISTFQWVSHLQQMLVLDSDQMLLYLQERKLSAAGRPWQTAFFLPSTADAGVSEFRRWFQECAGGRVSWPAGLSQEPGPLLPREQVLERFHSHVEQCKHCSGALALAQRLQVVCAALAALCVGALGALLVSGGGTLHAAAAAAGGIVAAAGCLLLRDLARRFQFVDFVHAFND